MEEVDQVLVDLDGHQGNVENRPPSSYLFYSTNLDGLTIIEQEVYMPFQKNLTILKEFYSTCRTLQPYSATNGHGQDCQHTWPKTSQSSPILIKTWGCQPKHRG